MNLSQDSGEDSVKRTVTTVHSYNYFEQKSMYLLRSFKKKSNETEQVIYTKPGYARMIEYRIPATDSRAGKLPIHNTIGEFNPQLEIRDTLNFSKLVPELCTIEYFESLNYVHRKAVLTKKKTAKLFEQYSNLSYSAFREFLNIEEESIDKRDFDVWVLKVSEAETRYATIYPDTKLAKFIQIVKKNEAGQVIDIVHLTFEQGVPIVMSQTYIDKHGNTRQVAHIGTTGNEDNINKNGMERFDDGTLLWTVSQYKGVRPKTGAAAMRPDGSIIIMKGSKDLIMSHFAARNMGAEQINPLNNSWSGRFSKEACIAEADDKFIARREYKQAVRQHVFGIIDGSSIPGLLPVYDI